MEMIRTFVVVGGVAGGMSAAARLRRLDDKARIVVLERSGNVSFANCGLPYHLSGTIAERSSLLLQTPESLSERFGLEVLVRHEVTRLDAQNRMVEVKNLDTSEVFSISYDDLVLAPGASPFRPVFPGSERGLVLRNVEDLDLMVDSLDGASSAVVVGGGFVGLEVAENLVHKGLEVSVVELADQILAPFDVEMASIMTSHLQASGVGVFTGSQVVSATSDSATLSSGQVLPADVLVLALGVRPENTLAIQAGLEIGARGGIKVNQYQQTSNEHIYAVGDACEKDDFFGPEATMVPLANLANRHGRRAADAIMGRAFPTRPAQATAIVGLFGKSAASTGLNERRAQALGLDYEVVHTHPANHAGYYPGATTLSLKILFEPTSGRLLGAQAIGDQGADKRIDVLSTAIAASMSVEDLIDLELAYAPAYGSAKDPINMLGYVAENRRSGLSDAIQWHELESRIAEGAFILDVRTRSEFKSGHVRGAANIPVDELKERLLELPSTDIVLYCGVGVRAHVAERILKAEGFKVVNLDGGWSTLQFAPVGHILEK